MGRTYRGEARDHFKGRNKNKNHSKKNQKKNWSEDTGKADNWSERDVETTESWDR